MRGGARAAAALALGVTAMAAPGSAGADPFRKGPYLQNVTQSSVTVMWESDDRTSGEIRVVGGKTFAADADELHEVVIDGLEPGHRYQYQVVCDGVTIDGEFATAPEAGAPFSFVVFGDSRSQAGPHLRVIERIRREVPDFILGTGDMVDSGANSAQWQEFFEIERELL